MTAQILLTPALRAKTEAAVEAAFKKAEKHYKRKFQRPEIRYNIRNTDGGRAYIGRNLIRLNLTFLVENEKEFLAQTVPHEVAHLVSHAVYDSKPMNGKKVRPHGREWKEACGIVGIQPKVTHSYDITSLDLQGRGRRVKRPISAKVADLIKQISKLEYKHRENIRLAIEEMGDE